MLEHENIIVWGHSLGAAIACRAVFEEEKDKTSKSKIVKLVLESPFNNLQEEIQEYVFTSGGRVKEFMGKMLPIARELRDANIEFSSDKWMKNILIDLCRKILNQRY